MSFTFYEDSAQVLMGLTDANAGKIVRAIINARFSGAEPDFNPMMQAVYALLKGQVDRAEKTREARSAGGKKGVSAKAAKSTNIACNLQGNLQGDLQGDPQGDPQANESTVTLPDQNLTFPDRSPTVPGPFPPTTDEVRAYCEQRKNNIDSEQFVDFYASKGWCVGNQPMRDWKASIRSWEKNPRSPPAGGSPAKPEGRRSTVDERDFRARERMKRFTMENPDDGDQTLNPPMVRTDPAD